MINNILGQRNKNDKLKRTRNDGKRNKNDAGTKTKIEGKKTENGININGIWLFVLHHYEYHYLSILLKNSCDVDFACGLRLTMHINSFELVLRMLLNLHTH